MAQASLLVTKMGAEKISVATHRPKFDRPEAALLFLPLLLTLFFVLVSVAFAASQESSLVALAQRDPRALVQETVRNEVKAEMDDATHWRFRKLDIKPSGSKTWDIIETKSGEVKHLIAINGHPLNAQQQQAEQERMQEFISSRSKQQQRRRNSSSDYNSEQKLMLMLPNALLFTYAGQQGDLVTLNFRPNPNFDATTHEAQVFHHMVGKLVVDVKNLRVAQFAGRIATPVEFGWGLLGHLDQGGTFDVEQRDVADGHWDMALLDTEITGRILFFKTLSIREKIVESDYQRVSDDLTLQQAANMLKSSAGGAASGAKTRRQSAVARRHD